MTLSSKIEVFTDFTFAVGLHTCTAVARSLCVSWAFLFGYVTGYNTTGYNAPLCYYNSQVNGVNGEDDVFMGFVCLSVCVCAQWTLNANGSKTVKVTDLKFDVRLPKGSPDMAA